MRRHRPLLATPSRLHAVVALLFAIAFQTLASPTYPSAGGDPQTASAACGGSGGGCLRPTGGDGSHLQATFGGVVGDRRASVDPAQSTWEHVYRDGHKILASFHSVDAHLIHCRPEPHGSCPPPDGASRVEFEGTGKVVLGDDSVELDANFQASIVDVGSCGGTERDFYSITIRRGLVVGQGEVVHELAGTIDCGNLKVDAPWRASSSESTPSRSPSSSVSMSRAESPPAR